MIWLIAAYLTPAGLLWWWMERDRGWANPAMFFRGLVLAAAWPMFVLHAVLTVLDMAEPERPSSARQMPDGRQAGPRSKES